MTRDFTLPKGKTAEEYDASALFRFLERNIVSDQLIGDIKKARKIVFVSLFVSFKGSFLNLQR